MDAMTVPFPTAATQSERRPWYLPTPDMNICIDLMG